MFVADVFPTPFEGAKLLINKGLSNHFQISHTMTMSSLSPSGYRFGCTYVGSQQSGPMEVRHFSSQQYMLCYSDISVLCKHFCVANQKSLQIEYCYFLPRVIPFWLVTWTHQEISMHRSSTRCSSKSDASLFHRLVAIQCPKIPLLQYLMLIFL